MFEAQTIKLPEYDLVRLRTAKAGIREYLLAFSAKTNEHLALKATYGVSRKGQLETLVSVSVQQTTPSKPHSARTAQRFVPYRLPEGATMNGLSRMAAIACLLLFAPCTRSVSASRFYQEASPAAGEATQHNAAGLAKAKNRDLDGAIVEFSEAIRLDPTYADAFRNRGLAKMQKDLVDEAIDDFSRAIVLNARDAAGFYNRGILFARKRQFDRANADFSAAIAINPTVASGFDQRGLAKTNKGDVDAGIGDLTTAISLDPKFARAYLNRGYAYSKKKDDAAALSNYSQAITLNPDYALAYSNRGEVKARLNDQVGAIADFTTALRLDSVRALPYYYRGLAKLTTGDHGGAIADFTAFLDRTPRHAGALTGRCQARREQGELELALADCNAALDVPPVSAHTLTERGEVKAATGDTYGAIRDLSEALSLEPKNADSRYQRCRLLAKRGDLADALSDCTEAIASNATLAGAYFERAGIRERRGDTTGADEDYGHAYALDPKLLRPQTVVSGTGTGAGPSAAGSAVGGVYRSGNGVTSPRVTHEQKPLYTAAGLERHIEGSVLLACVVRPDGTVGDVKVSRSLDPVYGLDTSAMDAAKQWTFEPGTKDGKPVPVLIAVEMTFTIDTRIPAAPLALPGVFTGADQSGLPSPTDSWQEQTFDQNTTRMHVAYPKGWITINGLAGNVIVLQSTQEPFGLSLLPPIATTVTFDRALSEPDLQQFANLVAKSIGYSASAVGQARVNGRLWLWLDFGEVSVADAQRASATPLGFATSLVNAAHEWLFTTVTAGRQQRILFFVTRFQNTSEPELQQLTTRAGPLFATVLERLSFESR